MTTLIMIVALNFNFSSVKIDLVKNTLETNSSIAKCSFPLESSDLFQDIAESEGECFTKAVTSIY